MPGNKNSGRRPRILSPEETRYALRELTRKSVAVIRDSLERGEVATAWRILDHVIGKPRQAVDLWAPHEKSATIDQVQERTIEIPQEVMEGALLVLLRAGVAIDASGYLVPSQYQEIDR